MKNIYTISDDSEHFFLFWEFLLLWSTDTFYELTMS